MVNNAHVCIKENDKECIYTYDCFLEWTIMMFNIFLMIAVLECRMSDGGSKLSNS